MFNLHKKDIKENDIVVLVLSYTGRKMIKCIDSEIESINSTRKQIVTLQNNIPVHNTHEDVSADYLLSEYYIGESELAIASNFIDCLQYITIKRKLKTVVLPAWQENLLKEREDIIVGANGELSKISRSYLKENKWTQEFEADKRNHFSPYNHTVIANKIIDAIDNNEKTIDLSSGWENMDD